jgi:hypothetical protein
MTPTINANGHCATHSETVAVSIGVTRLQRVYRVNDRYQDDRDARGSDERLIDGRVHFRASCSS